MKELVKSEGEEVRTNGATTNASYNTNEQNSGGLLELLCNTFCKDTPLAEMFGADQNSNQTNQQPLQTISHGEKFCFDWSFFLHGDQCLREIFLSKF